MLSKVAFVLDFTGEITGSIKKSDNEIVLYGDHSLSIKALKCELLVVITYSIFLLLWKIIICNWYVCYKWHN